MFFGVLQKEEINEYWHICSALVEKAMAEQKVRCYTTEDYYQPLSSGAMQLWIAVEADSKIIGAVITSLDKGTLMTICMVHVFGGEDINAWKYLADERITQFARENGCGAVQYAGRKGFAKIFPDLIEDGIIYVRKLK